MDIRQYDLWVDGGIVPHGFLEDFETQLDVSTVLTFNDGRMTNDDSGYTLIAADGFSFVAERRRERAREI